MGVNSKQQDKKHVIPGRTVDLSRIPDFLRPTAEKGLYQRSQPYPTNSIVSDFDAKPIVSRNTSIVTMGSCFAQELRKWLLKNQFHCLDHEWGVVYTPKSIEQIIRSSFSDDFWPLCEPFWQLKGKFYYPYIKANDHSGPMYLGETEQEAELALASHFRRSAQLLKSADLVVFTLGLTELWRNRQDKNAFFAVPYPENFNPKMHEFHSLGFEDVNSAMTYSIETLVANNPSVNILISVSPIPLSVSYRDHLGPYVATQFSKSILHAAALTLCEKYPNVHYMPSYEIVRNQPQHYYTDDGRHVTEDCVETIMKAFSQLYVES